MGFKADRQQDKLRRRSRECCRGGFEMGNAGPGWLFLAGGIKKEQL